MTRAQGACSSVVAEDFAGGFLLSVASFSRPLSRNSPLESTTISRRFRDPRGNQSRSTRCHATSESASSLDRSMDGSASFRNALDALDALEHSMPSLDPFSLRLSRLSSMLPMLPMLVLPTLPTQSCLTASRCALFAFQEVRPFFSFFFFFFCCCFSSSFFCRFCNEASRPTAA